MQSKEWTFLLLDRNSGLSMQGLKMETSNFCTFQHPWFQTHIARHNDAWHLVFTPFHKSLTNRATHCTVCNGLADPQTHDHHARTCYYADLDSSRSNPLAISRGTLGIPSPRGLPYPIWSLLFKWSERRAVPPQNKNCPQVPSPALSRPIKASDRGYLCPRTSYWRSKATTALSCTVYKIQRNISGKLLHFWTHG